MRDIRGDSGVPRLIDGDAEPVGHVPVRPPIDIRYADGVAPFLHTVSVPVCASGGQAPYYYLDANGIQVARPDRVDIRSHPPFIR
jgi:hypothetical protein